MLKIVKRFLFLEYEEYFSCQPVSDLAKSPISFTY